MTATEALTKATDTFARAAAAARTLPEPQAVEYLFDASVVVQKLLAPFVTPAEADDEDADYEIDLDAV